MKIGKNPWSVIYIVQGTTKKHLSVLFRTNKFVTGNTWKTRGECIFFKSYIL